MYCIVLGVLMEFVGPVYGHAIGNDSQSKYAFQNSQDYIWKTCDYVENLLQIVWGQPLQKLQT